MAIWKRSKIVSCTTVNGGVEECQRVHNVHRRSLTRGYKYDGDRVNRVRGTEKVPDLSVVIQVTGTLSIAMSRLL